MTAISQKNWPEATPASDDAANRDKPTAETLARSRQPVNVFLRKAAICHNPGLV